MRLATRPSKLARWQSHHVLQALQAHWPDVSSEVVLMQTRGDQLLDQGLPEIGGKGLFTAELDNSLRNQNVDFVVHSLKDLPVEEDPDLVIAAILPRGPSTEVLLTPDGTNLAKLPPGAFVGTSSLRRQAQVLAIRPDLRVKSIRGNVDTRIAKLLAGDYDAILLATAGVHRLGLTDFVAEEFPVEIMLPAPGQGALAVQCRRNDSVARSYLSKLDDMVTRQAVNAERSFLAALGGGCSLPVGANATVKNGTITLHTLVIAPDGSEKIQLSSRGKKAKELGNKLAAEALSKGAAEVLSV